MSTKIVTLPEPIPLVEYLAKDGRTHIWLQDQLSVRLNKNIATSYRSDVFNGRKKAPAEWILPLSDILGINVDEARELLGLETAKV